MNHDRCWIMTSLFDILISATICDQYSQVTWWYISSLIPGDAKNLYISLKLYKKTILFHFISPCKCKKITIPSSFSIKRRVPTRNAAHPPSSSCGSLCLQVILFVCSSTSNYALCNFKTQDSTVHGRTQSLGRNELKLSKIFHQKR